MTKVTCIHVPGSTDGISFILGRGLNSFEYCL